MDTKAGGNNMMYLPLDKLVSQPPQSVTLPNDTLTVQPAKPTEVTISPPEDPARARGVR
jgi:hypothetical protein